MVRKQPTRVSPAAFETRPTPTADAHPPGGPLEPHATGAEFVAESAAATELEPGVELAALLSGADGEPESNAPVAATSNSAVGARWRVLFAASTPREVLARLVPQDPLRIRAVVAERVRARCYLCDAERVFLRAVARVARFSVRYRGQPAITQWLAEQVDDALLDVLRDERGSERQRAETDDRDHAVFADLARPLQLDPSALRAACSRFNQMPEFDRTSFFALLIDGRDLDELARTTGKPAAELARGARRAFEPLLQVAAAHGTKEKRT